MKRSLLYSMYMLILLSLVALSNVVMAATVHDVCVKSMYPQACALVLNSDPRHTTTDLVDIAHIAIDKALTSVSATDKKIKSLLAQSRDPVLIRNLKECLSYYDFAIENCGRADDLIRMHDYQGVNGVGGVVNGSGADCLRATGPILRDDNTNAIVIGEVIGVISNMLDGKY